jgi:hypothetical protein
VKLFPIKLEKPTSEDASLLSPDAPLFDSAIASRLEKHGFLKGRVAEQKDKDGHPTGACATCAMCVRACMREW